MSVVDLGRAVHSARDAQDISAGDSTSGH
jgi:hypothetical protein